MNDISAVGPQQNQLKYWLDFFDKNRLGGSAKPGEYLRTFHGGDGGGENRPGLAWATEMMRTHPQPTQEWDQSTIAAQQAPEAAIPAAPVSPMSDLSQYAARYQNDQDGMGLPPGGDFGTRRPLVNNFLANLLTGRRFAL